MKTAKLTIKALIYKYTGVFLAYKEENEYVRSEGFWESFKKMTNHKNNDLSHRNAYGILIGLWQANNGFARPYVSLPWSVKYRHPIARIFVRGAEHLLTTLTVLKWDLRYLLKKVK